MGYFNGEKFIAEQVKSIMEQSHQNLTLLILDDASNNKQAEEISKLKKTYGNKIIYQKRVFKVGFVINFLTAVELLKNEFDYYAYADQDDIWFADKITRAISKLQQFSPETPNLYCSRTEIVDASGRHLGFSPKFVRKPSFKNALLQNIGGGNTMVFNRATKRLLGMVTDGPTPVSHDWWSYLIVSGAGGNICYDPVPSLKYRQHGGNLIGENISMRSKLSRLKKIFAGRYKSWNDRNIEALDFHSNMLTEKNREILVGFQQLKSKHLMQRLGAFMQVGLYRQKRSEQILFFLAVLLRKV
tara:strand:- start:1149 stop:2048 length:900 start_codon:yes stop_codon:yes gene_type:complete